MRSGAWRLFSPLSRRSRSTSKAKAFVAKPERPYAPACGAVADLNAIETNRLAPEDIDCARCVRNFQTTRRPGEFFTEQRERVEQIIIRNFQKRGLL